MTGPKYEMMIKQIRSLAEISRDETALLANASALLYESLPDLNWAGFYIVRQEGEGPEALIVGPFQGRPACVRIEKGRGVCGTSWAEDRTLVVPDVHDFPGHIACDSASNSEIVVPMRRQGGFYGVLDIDSPIYDRFSTDDAAGLEAFARALEELLQ
ncbi:MAG: GAF domain-containing protein [Clostridia bacterium]|nr:GAF domain-containing protein [Clostridia bacterium]